MNAIQIGYDVGMSSRFSKFFCSELVAAAFERAGVTGPINASEVTPIDLCRWRIYQSSYYQLKGDSQKRISRFNTASPAQWNISGQTEEQQIG